MTPNEAYAGYSFTINSHQFYIGLFPQPNAVDVYFAALLHKVGTTWNEVIRQNPLWPNLEDDGVTPQFVIIDVVNAFNPKIVELSGGTNLTWNQKLARLFQEGLVVTNGKLKIIPVDLG